MSYHLTFSEMVGESMASKNYKRPQKSRKRLNHSVMMIVTFSILFGAEANLIPPIEGDWIASRNSIVN